MNTIDALLKYIKCRDRKILLTTDMQISNFDLTVVVTQIISWLRLEHKRSIWIAQGRKNCLKPLKVDRRYPWGENLHKLVEQEKLFSDMFSIKEGKFDFSDTISEEDRIAARAYVYQNHTPSRHVYRRDYRKLHEKGLQWINKLMEIEFQGRDILFQQLLKAKIMYKQGYEFISMKFKVEGDIEPYPYHVRVPVEMRAFQQSSAPIIFLLHIVDGIIDELEVLTADLSQIDPNNIELERVEYEINQEVIMKK